MAGLTNSIGDELLRTHRNYQPLLARVPVGRIKGLAHITGGGLIDNLPRVLPKNCDAVIDTTSLARPENFPDSSGERKDRSRRRCIRSSTWESAWS